MTSIRINTLRVDSANSVFIQKSFYARDDHITSLDVARVFILLENSSKNESYGACMYLSHFRQLQQLNEIRKSLQIYRNMPDRRTKCSPGTQNRPFVLLAESIEKVNLLLYSCVTMLLILLLCDANYTQIFLRCKFPTSSYGIHCFLKLRN